MDPRHSIIKGLYYISYFVMVCCYIPIKISNVCLRERSGSVVECLTRDGGAAGSSLNGYCVVSLNKNINPSLVLVQPWKTRPFITERLLIGCKESNQTKNNVC